MHLHLLTMIYTCTKILSHNQIWTKQHMGFCVHTSTFDSTGSLYTAHWVTSEFFCTLGQTFFFELIKGRGFMNFRGIFSRFSIGKKEFLLCLTKWMVLALTVILKCVMFPQNIWCSSLSDINKIYMYSQKTLWLILNTSRLTRDLVTYVLR